MKYHKDVMIGTKYLTEIVIGKLIFHTFKFDKNTLLNTRYKI